MTPTDAAMREAFEKWCATAFGASHVLWEGDPVAIIPDGPEASIDLSSEWEAWQAASSREAAAVDDRTPAALEIVAKAAGYERAWIAPSGTPNIILERKHTTDAGMIQVARLDLLVSPASPPAPSAEVVEAPVRPGYERVEAYMGNGEIVVCGTPEPDDESHDCDAMGCSTFSHVVYRSTLRGGAR